ncbi:MAG: sn-glycerol-1-phosphate dehydrogenase [Clostridia bacterium]|nr:sn-glycerol-1-phosphate dehydrogenase [Clostridia bacterium]
MNFDFKNPCSKCGRVHESRVEEVLAGKGVLCSLPEILEKRGMQRPFLLSDRNTEKAAGERVKEILSEKGVFFEECILSSEKVEPSEEAMGEVILHYNPSCDGVIAIGSGVIGDLAKLLAATAKVELITVATAPSMDGFASETSSMVRGGVKVSLPSRCASVILGDTDILKNAPMKMLRAGLGDMLAKYISICEWRIANIITGEYYCEEIASLVRNALKKCVDNADGLLNRQEEAVEAVFEGLVLGGMAMSFAGVSRPASGVEHYISHVWEMRALERGEPYELHGLQCAVGTLVAARLYAKLLEVKPDREKALNHAKNYSIEEHNKALRAFLGTSAEPMIALEKKEKKYDPDLHEKRLEIILSSWEKIVSVIREEVPSPEALTALYKKISLPMTPEEIGIPAAITPDTFRFTGDIRDKYVLSRLLWDLGELEEFSEETLKI